MSRLPIIEFFSVTFGRKLGRKLCRIFGKVIELSPLVTNMHFIIQIFKHDQSLINVTTSNPDVK